jgi:hypothetical protein
MPRKYTITYHDAPAPISEPVTKFGGQPVWITEPQWPLSKMYRTPMQFICQIAVPAEIIGDDAFRIAYLFMTDWDGEGLFPDTFEPESGEKNHLVFAHTRAIISCLRRVILRSEFPINPP